MHLKHFLVDEFHASDSSVFCFTETGITSQNHFYADISEYRSTWKNIHKSTEHVLAIYYDTSRVTIESIPNVTPDFGILSVVMEIESKFVFLVLVYKPPLINQNTFIYQLQMQRDNLPTSKYRTIVLGDFNIDQLLKENVAVFKPIINRFHFQQRSLYSTHINGRTWDDFSDDEKTGWVNWMLSPYSNHFVVYLFVIKWKCCQLV